MSIVRTPFGNPRALYDAEFVPPTLLHREKELNKLLDICYSSLDEKHKFNFNAYIYGIHGIGKTVFTKYSLQLLKSNSETEFINLYLDMAVKSPSENLRLLIELYSQSLSQQFTYIKNSQELWQPQNTLY